MSLRTNITNTLRRPGAYFAGEWNRLAPRERRLASILVGVMAALVVVAAAWLTVGELTELEDDNEASREALAAIAKHRDEFLDAKSRMTTQETRIGVDPPQLAADLEAAAKQVNIQIPDNTPRPAVPAGKRYLEHSVDLSLRQVDLVSLSRFLAKLETGPRLIVISKMSIKRSYSEGEKLNVSLTATTYERVKEDRTKKRPVPAKEPS